MADTPYFPPIFALLSNVQGIEKKIHSAYGRPAREIIAVFSQRSYKVQHLEKMVREIQHTFTTKDKGTFCLLDWK